MFLEIQSFVSVAWPSLIIIAICAYLLGSINSAIIVTRFISRTDIRDTGSGNAGATNVLRSQGKLPAILTTLGDLGKSILSVLLGRWLISVMNSGYASDMEFMRMGAYLAGLFCIIGHLYPAFFGFRGGKGVLASLGMMLILDWRIALFCLVIFIVIVLIFKMVSLGSICAVTALPVITGTFSAFVYKYPAASTLFSTVMTVFIAIILIIKHIPNIKRIIKGTESRLGFGESRNEK